MHSSVYPSCPSVCREDVPCHFRCVTLPICHGYLNLSQSDATPLTFSGAMSMMGAEGWSWWHTECERLFGGRRMGRGGGPKGRGLAPIQSQVRIGWCFLLGRHPAPIPRPLLHPSCAGCRCALGRPGCGFTWLLIRVEEVIGCWMHCGKECTDAATLARVTQAGMVHQPTSHCCSSAEPCPV